MNPDQTSAGPGGPEAPFDGGPGFPDDPAEGARRLQEFVMESPDVGLFLTELATMAASALSTQDNPVACGVTVLRERKPRVAASSDARAQSLDETQNGFGDGPCLTALRQESSVLVPELLGETRWPDYTRAAVQQGIRSILAVPLELAGEAEGVVNLYSGQPGGFLEEDVRTAANFVANASRSLRLALRMARLRDVRDDLMAAVQSRTAIDMAVGAIMAQNHCSQAEAFQILNRASNTRNVKLRDIASTVISSIGRKSNGGSSNGGSPNGGSPNGGPGTKTR
ncbi:GAF and ANTAR domain-containing protein [Arthrobacter sp. CDRTa11]|uniref:GAF and ANTAR domain-containing protein n=1 Tax=Arthrobacter sp. CDRTa11 TaxID=2651199 RepID=UPI002265E563|nr:GAF and ANTAR domain-containing protein [Arthrobacter sp. CDRTa11]